MKHSTERFSDRADAYSKHRPRYPDAAFNLLFSGLGDARELHVADIGAGTGIASEQLAARVATVHAVEPNAAMRAQARTVPNVDWHNATAENTGLPNGSTAER